jgi:hypothetical protein
MMEIRECGTGWPASFTVKLNGGHWYEVSHNNELRAIFLSKEDAQRFIRNETIRREAEKPVVDTYYKTWNGPEPDEALTVIGQFVRDALASDLPEPDAIVETK